MHYFDYNATAPLHPAARAAWLEIADELWANPSSASQFSAQAHRRLMDCREVWARAFGVEGPQVVFLGGATEALNAVFVHLFEVLSPNARVAVSTVEHPAVREAATRWFAGVCDEVLVDAGGRVDLDALETVLRAGQVAAFALMAANNETGVLQPLDEVAELCRSYRVRLLCDATQWVGKRPLAALPRADFLVFGGHKFGGPRGVAGLVLAPTELGFRGRVGGGQQAGHQSGTEDLAGIAAMTAAFEAQPPDGWNAAPRDAFLGMLEGGPFEALFLGSERLPNTVSLLTPRHRASRWIARLDRHGFIVSSGSACSTGGGGPSPILRASGLSRGAAERVLRISGGGSTSEAEWRALRAALDTVLAELDADEGQGRLTTVVELDD